MIQGVVQTQVVDENREQESVLDNVRHHPGLHVTLGRDDGSAISLQLGVRPAT